MLPHAVCELLRDLRSIAVVGFSSNPSRPSHWIAQYLIEQGFEVQLVNPRLQEGLGRPVHPGLSALPARVDLVDVFRAPEHVPQIVAEAATACAGGVWMQPGAENPDAAEEARRAGLTVVVGRCLYADHKAWRAG